MDASSYREILAYARRNLFGDAAAHAEDCAQYIAMRLLESPKSSHWYLLVDWCRENGFVVNRAKSGARALGSARGYFEYNPEQDARGSATDGAFDLSDLDRLLSRLPERHREILKLRAAGKSNKQIGELYGFSESRASQLVSQAIHVARKCMKNLPSSLSKTETEVAQRLLTGLSNKEIAEQQFVCEKTVKFHLTNIYAKCGVATRSQMLATYNRQEESLNFDDSKEEEKMANWEPMTQRKSEILPTVQPQNTPLARQDGQDQVNFVVNTFRINESIDHLQTMSREVTKGDYSVEKVMAACQCIGRMNETIQTVMKAAQVLKGR
jgi:RNA polymerase sigma factor (sigma-70 family)